MFLVIYLRLIIDNRPEWALSQKSPQENTFLIKNMNDFEYFLSN